MVFLWLANRTPIMKKIGIALLLFWPALMIAAGFYSSLAPQWYYSTAFIEKGSPQQNAFVERFNGTMRDEVLNGESFRSVLEARVVIAAWVHEYNTLRPHRGLGMTTPAAFFESLKAGSR